MPMKHSMQTVHLRVAAEYRTTKGCWHEFHQIAHPPSQPTHHTGVLVCMLQAWPHPDMIDAVAMGYLCNIGCHRSGAVHVYVSSCTSWQDRKTQESSSSFHWCAAADLRLCQLSVLP